MSNKPTAPVCCGPLLATPVSRSATAHASAWDGMLRWNGKTDYIVYNGLYSQEGQPYQPFGQGRTELEAQKASYDRPASKFGMSQDTLCNKCHNGVYP